MLAFIGLLLILIGAVLSVLRPRPPATAVPLMVGGLVTVLIWAFK